MINKQADINYTYKDYIKFSNDIRSEIIDGVIYDMSPAPSAIHQRLLGFVYVEIGNYLKGKSCEAFPAPFDVFLLDKNQEMKECNKIVQPDISIICDKSKITEKGCIGAPDFILEVVSPWNRAHDYVRKLNLYNNFKVREYWIANPENKTVVKYLSDGENFGSPVQYTFSDKIKVDIFEDLEVDFREFGFNHE